MAGGCRERLGKYHPRIMTSPSAACPEHLRILHLIPMAHVADVERSLAFYARLGFVRGDTHADAQGKPVWASAVCPATSQGGGKGAIMFAQANGPVDAGVQAVLFYMYSTDVGALRRHLLSAGVMDGGAFGADAQKSQSHAVLFDLVHPFYMPAGQLRIHDPDGYVILVGQLQ